jgi:serine/threonine protein kinase
MTPSSPADPLTGTVLSGQFRLVERLASGGMGTVYSAEQLDANNRSVAVKLLELPKTLDPDTESMARERFQREAKAMSLLTHPHTVRLYAFGDDPETGLLWLAMEKLEGMDLGAFIELEAPMAPERAVRIVEQICRSVGDAHSHGIIHRDLKPANIFLCTHEGYPEWVKVLDFGIARVLGDDADLTGSGRFTGTPKYMAPEQGEAGSEVTASADFYALGCILFEMLTGSSPYPADSVATCLHAHMHDPIPRVVARGLYEEEGNSWDHAFLKILAKRAGGRPQSATEMIALLESTLSGQSHEPDRPPTSPVVGRVDPVVRSSSVGGSGGTSDAPERGSSGASRWLWALWLFAGIAALALWSLSGGQPEPDPAPKLKPVVDVVKESAQRSALDLAYERDDLPTPPGDCRVESAAVISPLLNALSMVSSELSRSGAREVLDSLVGAPALESVKSQPEVVFIRGLVSLRAGMASSEVAGLADVAAVQCPGWIAPPLLKAWALMTAPSKAVRASAIPILEGALESDALSKEIRADVHVRLARLYETQPEKVVSIATAVIERFAGSKSVGQATLLRGAARLSLGRAALATSDLKEAIRLNEGGALSAPSYLALARAIRHNNPKADVRKYCLRAITLARNSGREEIEAEALTICPDKPDWERVYRGLIAAYNAHGEEAYFKAFANPMDCYYTKVQAARGFLRDSRAAHFRDRTGSRQRIEELRVLWSGAAEVGFVESGELRSGSRAKSHERGIIMRRLDGEWRVTVEVSREKNGCAPELFNDAPEPEVMPPGETSTPEPSNGPKAPSIAPTVTPTVAPSAGSPPAEAPRP